MNIEFNSVKELYDRLLPALVVKKNELKRNKINYIKEEDIWNYLKETKWKIGINLELNDLVSDILNCSILELEMYIKDEPNIKLEK